MIGTKKNSILTRIKGDAWYLIFILPTVVLLFLFNYLPIYGLAIAFQDYKVGSPIISFNGSTIWVGFKQFTYFINSIFFARVFGNTMRLSLELILFGQWVPLLAALLLNEIKVNWYKRTCQTFFYLPYFVSVAIVVSIMSMLFNSSGPISQLSSLFGGSPTNYMRELKYFDLLYVGSGIWQSFGYGTIIYLAAISGVDLNLYEAATVDGANRLHKIIHVTLPHLVPTFILMTILAFGGVLNTSYEKVLLMYGTSTMERADVIGTYIYRVGLTELKYSYTTAIGLFTNIINVILLLCSNIIARRFFGYGLW